MTGTVLPPSETATALPWLVRLRWGAVIGQLVAVLFAYYFLHISFPLVFACFVVAITVFSNVLLREHDRRGDDTSPLLLTGILVLDTLSLTAILFLTGGSGNPFSALYVIHVIMAVIVLRPLWAWAMVALSIGCYGLLFLAPPPVVLDHAAHVPGHEQAFGSHLVGMWAALSLALVLVAYSAGRILAALRHREAELRHARELVEKNMRLAAITTLAAGVAHELGSPLGTIAVAAHELSKSTNGDITMRQDVGLIRAEVDRCRAILDQMHAHMLESSTEETPKSTAAELVTEIGNRLGQSDMARVRVDISDAELPLRVPFPGVSQSVASLVTNALEASARNEPVDLVIRTSAGMLEVSVEDCGTGIPKEIVDRVDEPFFTIKESGAGLGLFLARATAEHLGGEIAIETNEPRGTRVRFRIPLEVDA